MNDNTKSGLAHISEARAYMRRQQAIHARREVWRKGMLWVMMIAAYCAMGVIIAYALTNHPVPSRPVSVWTSPEAQARLDLLFRFEGIEHRLNAKVEARELSDFLNDCGTVNLPRPEPECFR